MFQIIGKYQTGAWEIIEDEIDSRREGERLLSEYRMAFGNGWALELQPSTPQRAE